MKLTFITKKPIPGGSMLDHKDIHSETTRVPSSYRKKQQFVAWLFERIRKMAGMPPEALDMTRPLVEYGIRSAQLMQVVAEFSDAFSLHLPPTMGFDYPTIDSLASAVADSQEKIPSEQSARNAPAAHHMGSLQPKPAFPQAMSQPVAVIGMWCRFPGGCDSPEKFWDFLITGQDAIAPIPEDRFDASEFYDPEGKAPGKMFTNQGGFLSNIDLFDADFFGISPREAIMTDPQQRILLETAWNSLEHAGINPDSVRKTKTGVFIGASGSDYGRMMFNMPDRLNLYSGTGASSSILANRISYALGAQGPSMTIDTACSSSLVAIHTACRSLQNGDSDLALAGGVNLILSPEMTIIFSQAQLMAPDGRCKVFDQSANGYVRSEGCGVLVLKRLCDAEYDGDRIWGTVLSSEVNQDGQSNGLTVPNGESQKKLLAQALRKAGVAPHQVSYLEAHGTGTRVGDPIEVTAAGAVLGQNRRSPLLLGSVKSNIGHLEQAAGVAGVIKVLLALHHGIVPANLHFTEANPLINLDAIPARVPTEPTPWDEYAGALRVAGVSGFSFGGTNAHIILAEPPVRAPRTVPNRSENVLCLTARSAKDLCNLAKQQAEWLDRNIAGDDTSAIDVSAACCEANTRRTRFSHRLAVTGRTAKELSSRLEAFASGEIRPGTHAGTARKTPCTAFLFTGQGAQYMGMGSAMYSSFPRFREILDHCDALLRPHLDRPLLDVILHAPDVSGLLDQTAYTQPALFSLEYALAQQMQEWGIVPDMLMGHSVGEYAAACHAGVFSLEDGIRLIASRGRLIQSLPREGERAGAMAAVFAEKSVLAPLLSGSSVVIAATNSPENTVISGPKAELSHVLKNLDAQNIRHVRLSVSHAFHSPLMDPILDTFEAVASMVDFSQPRIPIVSNVTGTLAEAHQLTTASYWREHIRSEVRFMQGMRTLQAEGAELFVEIGPHPVLTGMGRSCLDNPARRVWAAPLVRSMQDLSPVAETLAAVHACGVDVNWNAYYPETARCAEPLPAYPFDRTSYWLEMDPDARPLAITSRPARATGQHDNNASADSRKPENILALLRAEKSDTTRQELLTRHIAGTAARILLRSVQDVLGSERPLIRLGLDSLMAMQLKSELDSLLGTNIPLTDFLAEQTIQALAEDILKQLDTTSDGTPETHLSITTDTEHRHDLFPLTDVQHAYWAGRQPDMELGGVSCQVYVEVDAVGLDVPHLEKALDRLVQRHDMLRAVVDADGMQRVLPTPGPYAIRQTDLADLADMQPEKQAEILSLMRTELSRQVIDPSTWPLFDIRATRLKADPDTTRLHITFDMLVGDGMSFMILIDELEALYLDDQVTLPELDITFRDYVLAEKNLRNTKQYETALAYWKDRLHSLPPAPQLPLARPVSAVGRPVFSRLRGRMDKNGWTAFREQASQHGLTPSAALLAAFSEVLAAWSASPHFSINLTMFNRLPVHEDIGHIVGDFTTLSLLEADISDAPFASNANAIQTRLWKDMEHRHVSAITVMREMRKLRGADTPGDMPVVFTSLLPLTGTRGNSGFLPADADAEVAYCISQTPQVWLDHQVYEEDGELRFNWDYVRDIFPEGMVDAMLETYNGLLERLAVAPEAWTAPLRELAPARHLETIRELNSQTRTFPGQAGQTLHGLFEQSVREHPDRTALATTDKRFSYKELRGLAERIARSLVAKKTASNELVAVLMHKGWEQIAAVLGILKAGAAYLPIEADQPEERILTLLREGRVRTVLTQPALAAAVAWPKKLDILPVEETLRSFAENNGCLLPETTPEDLAYVIFTSGSTGRPKGVAQDHQSVVNTVLDINQRFHLGSQDAILGLSNLNFDLSVFDIFGAFAVGATLVLPDADQRREPAHWLDLLHTRNITIWNSAPALMQMLMLYLDGQDAAPSRKQPALRQVLLSGDWIPVTLPARIRSHFAKADITSLGGATEAAIWSISHPATHVDENAKSIPYGTPLTNQKLMVLDERFRIRPAWSEGQLFIGGAGLALGYFGDKERTQASFVRHPHTGERLYRTGDLGRYRDDGVIEFIGRADFQVKIRGHRIEPGEVEHALKQHPDIAEALVVVAGTPGQSRRLVAYVHGPELSGLDAFLRSKIPPYMVPSEFVFLDCFPLTPSGKIDRKALPLPRQKESEKNNAQTQQDGPRSETETALLAIWREVMDNQMLGVTDDFFASGGDSLLATRIVAAVRKRLETDLSLNTIFTAPTVREVAAQLAPSAALRSQENILPPLIPNPAARLEPFPLTDIQHAYWMGRDAAFELGNVSAHFYYEIENTGLDVLRLEQAWQKVVARHDMLRAVILPDGRQRVLEEVPACSFRQNDLRDLASARVEERLLAIREEMSSQKLPPDVWPLFDIRVSLLPGDKVRVHIDIDNVIADAWSLFTFLKEWADFYAAPEPDLPPVPLTFRDYVLAEHALRQSRAYERDKAYWMDRIATLPAAPELPLACSPSDIGSPRFTRINDRLDAATWKALKAHAANSGLTPSALLISAYAEVLSRWSATPRFTINITLFNRLPLHPQVDTVVGDFTSLNLLQIDRTTPSTFMDHARQAQAQLWQDMDHRLFSGVEVMREISRNRKAYAQAVMPVVFTSALLGSVGHDAAVLTKFGEMTYSIFQTPQVWLDHQVYELNGELVLNWDFIDGLFPDNVPADMFSTYTTLLRDLAAAQDWSTTESRLPAPQMRRIETLNDTVGKFPKSNSTLHGLFAASAQNTPDAPAIVQGETTSTYAQLDTRSEAIARALVSAGVQPGQPVAVILEKGPAQIQAVLGILRAGAAYLPMVPPLPPKRLQAILTDSRAAAVLTSKALAGSIAPNEEIRVLTMEDIAESSPRKGSPALAGDVAPDSLAYIIYTSGSTGTPKGVAIDHKGAVNTILDINDRFEVTADDRVLALSSLGFDLSVYDIFGLLAAGGTIVLPDSGMNDPAIWLTAMRRHEVTLWNSAPALMQMLHAHIQGTDRQIPPSLRLALLSGDWIPLEVPEHMAKTAPQVRLVGLGGATEASIWSVLHPIDAPTPHWNSVPYGRPMKNQRMYVLDNNLAHRPEWVPGDLYIAGDGLAMGYWNDPEKTAAGFISHPRTGERLYRTGDLARYRPEGELEFMGRTDHQIKIRGHRVEPGEIEAAARSFPGVETALVLLHKTDKGEQMLVAYIVPSKGTNPDTTKLRAHLEERLPFYMIPASVMLLDALPVTANGKVDRAGLPAPAQVPHPGASPETVPVLSTENGQLESILHCIREILHTEHTDPDANFFELGLTSFHLVQIQAAIREKQNREIPIADFFLHPTASLLAASLTPSRVPAFPQNDPRSTPRRGRSGATRRRGRA